MAEPQRTARARDTREDDERPMTWRPPELLPAPDPQPGYIFRWVRLSAKGKDDPMNLSSRMREGWTPVKAVDHPEVHIESNSKGELEFGGLVLCKMPTEMVEQRNAYYRRQATDQMESVDNAFMRENDARMPLFKERKSKVTFGSGT